MTTADNHSTLTVAEAGEIESLTRTVSRLGQGAPSQFVLVGPGDDCAVVSAPDARFVVTTDTMVEGPDFRLGWSSWFDLGWKAVASNVSDVAAMGARPTALVVALVVPGSVLVADLEAFADGLKAACDALAPGCSIVGGDLASGSQVVIAVTAHGTLEGREPVLRSGARPGDILAVGGTLGQAACGLALLFSGTDVAAAYDEWVAVQLRPMPPVGLGVEAALAGASSMLDISDGLAKDAARIGRASGATLDISSSALFGFEARLEGAAQALCLHAGDGSSAERLTRAWVLGGGEDHSLLATFPAQAVLPRGFKAIGRVVSAGDSAVLLDGSPLVESGWDSSLGR